MEINENGEREEGRGTEEFSYKGYEVVRGVFFAHLFEPSVKFADETVSVNSACIRRLPDAEYVQFLVNREEKKLAVEPCTEESKDSFRWSTVGKDGKVKPKTITCKPFYERVMKLMDWDPKARYRITGKLIRTKKDCIFVFDLNNVEIFKKKGPGEDKRVIKPTYPEGWSDGFGVSAEVHQNDNIVSIFRNDEVFYLEKDDNGGKEENGE